MSANPRQHRIDYIEFPVRDIAIAKQFYGKVFGWQFTDYGPGYCGIRSNDGGEMGGFCHSDQVQPGSLLVVLFSEDLAATFAAVQAAGAEITREIFSFPGGRRFEFKDPNGYVLAVWCDQP